jgi:7,8-dihydroneopterin aldolase/epimerase/oxygenase
LRIWVRLGCSDQEKFNPQLVSLNVELYFKVLPEGATSDRLEDTVCYSDLVQNVKSFCRNRQFNLIEYLTAEIYQVVKDSLKQHRSLVTFIGVTGHKMSPPVPDIYGGVTFTYCDDLSSTKE